MFHKVSKKYPQLFVNELKFFFSNRMNPAIFRALIWAC